MAVFLVLAGLAALLGLFWIFFAWDFNYWSNRGVPSMNPYSLFGERGGGAKLYKAWEGFDDIYQKYKSRRIAGSFQFRRPALVIMDPELVKVVMTKDFASFPGRGQPVSEDGDPLSANLFNLEGPRWKNLRNKLSPTFTSGKLKLMFPLMVGITDQLKDFLKEKVAKKEEVEFKDPLTRYATDIIGTVAFGIDCNSLKCAENEFHSMTRELFKVTWSNMIWFFFIFLHPVFTRIFTFRRMFRKATTFFLRLMKETVEHRETNKIERNDFVSLMMQLRESDRHELDRVSHIEFTHEVMTAQAFLFFLAGLDNVSNTVGFALHELALNPELQARAAEEVRDCVAKHKGMTYEAVKDMGLIERIVRESLRKWPPVAALSRQPNGPYTIPGTDVTVDSKAVMWIPVWQFNHDPDYFPEPERFDPERFTEEAKDQRHPYVYLPFGEGPRFCIAERFAMLEMNLCLASLLQDFQLSVGSKTDVACELDTKSFTVTLKNGFWLRVEDRP